MPAAKMISSNPTSWEFAPANLRNGAIEERSGSGVGSPSGFYDVEGVFEPLVVLLR
jgi:hypothetical protein